MKNQRFGIEIEMTGLTRKEASEIIALHFSSLSDARIKTVPVKWKN